MQHLSNNTTLFLGLCLSLSCSIERLGLNPDRSQSCRNFLLEARESDADGSSLENGQFSIVIDNAPSNYSVEIATLLTQQASFATFFVQGSRLRGNPTTYSDQLTGLRDLGHLIGNGGLSGRALASVPLPAVELRQVDVLLRPFIVGDILVFRTAASGFNGAVAKHLSEEGLGRYLGPIAAEIIREKGDAIDSYCWDKKLNYSECSQRYLETMSAKGKGIIRFTDGHAELFSLLQDFLPKVSAAGFRIVRLDSVPEIRRQLLLRGASPDRVAGPGGCDDYE